MNVEVVAGVIRRGNKILLCTRPDDKPPKGREFPGGKIEPGETPERALERELAEELDITTRTGRYLTEITVVKPGKNIHIVFYESFLADDAVIVPQERQTFDFFELNGPIPEDLLEPDCPVWLKLPELLGEKGK